MAEVTNESADTVNIELLDGPIQFAPGETKAVDDDLAESLGAPFKVASESDAAPSPAPAPVEPASPPPAAPVEPAPAPASDQPAASATGGNS